MARFRVAADSLFTAFFPDNCRLCKQPLTAAGAAPVCSACMASLEDWGGALLCSGCQQIVDEPSALDDRGYCGVCRREPPVFSRVWSSGPYDGALRRTIHLLKYDGVRPLADVMASRLESGFDAVHGADLIVPAPLHWRRTLTRGFNQSALIARRLGDAAGVRYERRLLARVRHTSSQAGLSQHERRRNLRGAFRVQSRETIQGKTVLLVDDVMTTGATLSACARALKRAGAQEVRALVVARALLGRRAH